MSRLIIAGSRTLNPSVKDIADQVHKFRIPITEVVSGGARGVDTCAIKYALAASQPYRVMEADWEDLSNPDAIIKTNKFGKQYDALAGYRRNKRMAEYADALLLIHCNTGGSLNMKSEMQKLGKPVYEVVIK